MAPRAIFAFVALALLAATARAEHVPPNEPDALTGCVTIGWWPPPPYVGVGSCDRLQGAVYVNGTAVGWHLP